MPTYEYLCEACGHKFDKFQSMSAPLLKECPSCHKKKLRRLIGTGAGLIFKGSGFYITDYRSENYKDSAKKESGAGKKPDTKAGEGKTAESKGDTKATDSTKPAESKPPESKPAESKPKTASKSADKTGSGKR
jgi:putative FmdB family regulatory protein